MRFSLTAVLSLAVLCWVQPVHAQDASGLNDLVVYDAGAHYRDLPAVNFVPIPGGNRVDIVPKVHVHRYYYSGDKIFQGPVIEGGPVTVVAKHPVTNEQLYIDVSLPSGAPQIHYTGHSITYVYQQSRVKIAFPRFTLDRGKASVSYCDGRGIVRSARQWTGRAAASTQEKITGSPVVRASSQVVSEVGKLGAGAHQATSEFVAGAIDTMSSLADSIPGVVPLKSYAESRQPDVPDF